MADSEPIFLDNIRSVAIVGGGGTGIVTLKTLLEEGKFERVHLFERRSNLGGVWLFDDHVAQEELARFSHDSSTEFPFYDSHGQVHFPSPTYRSMIGNVAHELQSFNGHQHPGLALSTGSVEDGHREETNLYATREQEIEYLRTYIDKHQLVKWVSLNTEVISVRSTEQTRWKVITKDTSTGSQSTSYFDAIIYAGGLWDRTFIPQIDGIEALPRERLVHARFYRSASVLTGKRVFILGNGNSANDIAAHAADVAQLPVYRSIRHRSYFSYVPDPDRIHDIPPATKFSLGANGTVIAELEGGRTISDIDIVVAATGYRYSVPSLRVPSMTNLGEDEPATTEDGHRMIGLYKHLFHARHPTLAFPGFAITWAPFSIYEAQAAVIARVFAGRLSLPSTADMLADEGNCIKAVGDHYKFHVLALYEGGDAAYGNDMRDWALQAEDPERGTAGVLWDEQRKWLLDNSRRLKTLQMKRERGMEP
ncbi:hypothetical protein BKA62DRAFT_697273 [Auriculariales sp. MPI-PUGE-AT-0066]|nr:hypothetical protein BKA62DRAFT_697273 [Auriculariales sp. MPI-PUGE-AT-0066]